MPPCSVIRAAAPLMLDRGGRESRGLPLVRRCSRLRPRAGGWRSGTRGLICPTPHLGTSRLRLAHPLWIGFRGLQFVGFVEDKCLRSATWRFRAACECSSALLDFSRASRASCRTISSVLGRVFTTSADDCWACVRCSRRFVEPLRSLLLLRMACSDFTWLMVPRRMSSSAFMPASVMKQLQTEKPESKIMSAAAGYPVFGHHHPAPLFERQCR